MRHGDHFLSCRTLSGWEYLNYRRCISTKALIGKRHRKPMQTTRKLVNGRRKREWWIRGSAGRFYETSFRVSEVVGKVGSIIDSSPLLSLRLGVLDGLAPVVWNPRRCLFLFLSLFLFFFLLYSLLAVLGCLCFPMSCISAFCDDLKTRWVGYHDLRVKSLIVT